MYIVDLDLDTIHCDETIEPALEAMNQLQFFSDPIKESVNDLAIIHHNVEGLLDNFAGVLQFFASYSADVIMMTETKLSADISNLAIGIEGYTIMRNDRQTNGGGVAIYSSKICVSQKLDFQNITLEHVGIQLQNGLGKYVLIVIYLPPNANSETKKRRNAELEIMIQNSIMMQQINAVIFAGDFNENLNGKQSKPIHDLFKQYGFSQEIKEITTKGGTLIDHIYVRENKRHNKQAGVIQTHFSYHDACFLTMDLV